MTARPGILDFWGGLVELTVVGSGAGHRTLDRGASAVLVRAAQWSLLVDCGAGTLDALLRGVVPSQIDAIFVTHPHPDHVGDFMNLLAHWSAGSKQSPLAVYAPPETAADLAVDVARLQRMGILRFPVALTAVGPTETVQVGDLHVRAFETDHRIESRGYRIEAPASAPSLDMERVVASGVPIGPMLGQLKRGEPVTLVDGRVVQPRDVCEPFGRACAVAITGDTAASLTVIDAVRGVNVLVHEATFADDKQDNAAYWGHSTARQAGEVASAAGVGALVLTHISHRYDPGVLPHAAEAAETFAGNVIVASDGMRVDVRRGAVYAPVSVWADEPPRWPGARQLRAI